MELAVLLRNCKHDSTDTNHTTHQRYALKCDSFSIQVAKTPIQVPVPQQAPQLIDIGFYRPSISIGGIVDTVGTDTTTSGVTNGALFQNLEKVTVSRKYWTGNTSPTDYDVSVDAVYYLPTKNILEEAVYTWITTADDALELEIGDANYPQYNRAIEPTLDGSSPVLTSSDFNATGGGLYVVAIQQARFQVDPAQEDRWQFQMQFVCESRKDVTFTG
tara:strand:- start:890 stop:1540 length:651 start_codon:yes stop_codon:yes gene_type:complete